ncbi:hypothetical protein MK489_21465 [Myxococcota bacterium]|nr:hypothetical protein [Myxococcota bacterium]
MDARAKSPAPDSARLGGFSLGIVLVLALALRLIGFGWGLPGSAGHDPAPIHPDEHEAFFEAANLYNAPVDMTFVKGGAFYIRLGWLARNAVEAGSELSESEALASTILVLRSISLLAGLGTVALVMWIGARVGGREVGIGAGLLLATAPFHVLDCHYARPDALTTFFATGALAFGVRGGQRDFMWGGVCAGLATATLLSGVIGFVSLGVLSLHRRREVAGRAPSRTALRDLQAVGLGALLGYGFGNAEAALHPSVFVDGLRAALDTHQGGVYALPWRLFVFVSPYAFGGLSLVAGFAGLVALARRREPVDVALCVQWLVGWLLLGQVGGSMMRHLEIVGPVTLTAAAFAAVEGGRWVGRRLGREAWGSLGVLAVLGLWNLQLSLGYVLPMQWTEDARYRMGRWIVEHVPRGSSIGVTVSFYGDHSYGPRFPADATPSDYEVAGMMLRSNFDASEYLDMGIDFIATSDYARDHAAGPSARGFFRDLPQGRGYRLVAIEAPGGEPLVSLPRLAGWRRPGDLHYVQSTFYLFQRMPKRVPERIPEHVP